MTQQVRAIPALLPLVERAPRLSRARVRLQRFVEAVRDPVPLLDQMSAVAGVYLDERARLRRKKRQRTLTLAEHDIRLKTIDGLRAARATLARLVEIEAAHMGGEIAPSTRHQVDAANADAPTALEVAAS